MTRRRLSLPLKKEETVFDRLENLVARAASSQTDRHELIRQTMDIDRTLRAALAAGDSLGASEGLSAAVGLALLRGVAHVTATPIRPQDTQAITAMGKMIDATLMEQPAYHYAGHFYDVAMVHTIMGIVSHRVVRDSHLTPSDMARRVVVGFAHDLGHTGGNNQFFKDAQGRQNTVYRPFHFEEKSNKLIAPILERAGYAPDEITEIQLQILGTEPRTGPALFDKAESFYATKDLGAREKIREAARASFYAAYQPLREAAQQKGEAGEVGQPSQAQQAFFDKLFVDRARFSDEQAYRDACAEGQKFLATEDHLTGADLAFSTWDPQTHAANTVQLKDEFDTSGVQGITLIDNGALHPGGLKGYFNFGVGLPVQGDQVMDKTHRNRTVQYMLYPSFIQTARTLLGEALAGEPLREVPDSQIGRKAFDLTAKNRVAQANAQDKGPKPNRFRRSPKRSRSSPQLGL